MALTTGKYQWDDRTGSDADQDVPGEAFNKHSFSAGKKTVSIYAEIDELIATSEGERRTLGSGATSRRSAWIDRGACWK